MSTPTPSIEIIARVSDSLGSANELEEIVRPLLELLEAFTGLESTYVTRIDELSKQQFILYARNTKQLVIPEGLSVPLDDTLCWRAIHEGRTYCDDVGSAWSDSQAARALGINTYATSPIYSGSDQLFGTLCAASNQTVPMRNGTDHVMRLFSQLIGRYVEREQLLQQLQQAQSILENRALTDSLTGLPNRLALMEELRRRLARCERDNSTLFLAYIDLDHFKVINDSHGHEAGDHLLIGVSSELKHVLRVDDFLARIGGDEFIAMASLQSQESTPEALVQWQQRLVSATQKTFLLGQGIEVAYSGASIGSIIATAQDQDIDTLLARADVAMYNTKRQRRTAFNL